MGLEAAGVVEATTGNKWKPGDRVMALLSGGGYAEYCKVHEGNLIPIPKEFSWSQAAAIPEVWLTAYQLIRKIANIQQAETVLVHAAASGVGTAAIQMITKIFHGKVIGTAGSNDKCAFVKKLGAAECINYKEEDFEKVVSTLTNGKGVDIILDCVGGSYWEKNANSVAVDGRWVLYGLLGGGNVNGDLFARLMKKRVRLEATGLRTRSQNYKAELVSNFTSEILPHIENGSLKPIIAKEFSMGQIADAHEFLESNENMGKVILIVQNEHRKDIENHEEL